MNMQLSERDREILKILIADYIATADPVGSRTIAKKLPGHLSAATVRNVMADLTDMGLLAQPHTSAGRVPTSAAFRYYVDSLLKRRELSEGEMEAIREKCRGDERSVGAVISRTSRLLAAVSHYVGLVATPRTERMAFKQIEFMPLSRNRILGILVSKEGVVENRLIEVNEDLTYPELERITNYCNQAFSGLTLDEARDKVRQELLVERADYDRLIRKAMIYSGEILEGVPESDLVIDGEMQLLDAPEFASAESFKKLVEALEEKEKVLHMLERCGEGEGVRIFVGADAQVGGVGSVGVVSAPYFKDGRAVGTLGIIGPMRMDYSRVVPIVDFTAKVLGDVLEK